jgi:hypothetical protein
MTSNPEPSVQQREHDVHNLLAYGMGLEARAQTAYTVERPRFRRLLALGAARVRLFVVTRAAVRSSEPILAADGPRRVEHAQRPTPDDSVVGTGRCWRHDSTAPGHDGLWPLAAAVSLPVRGDADL